MPNPLLSTEPFPQNLPVSGKKVNYEPENIKTKSTQERNSQFSQLSTIVFKEAYPQALTTLLSNHEQILFLEATFCMPPQVRG